MGKEWGKRGSLVVRRRADGVRLVVEEGERERVFKVDEGIQT